MKRLRLSYLVLGACAVLLMYGLIDASGRTAAVFVDAREATGFVDASVSFPGTPTTSPATEEPVETATAPLTTTPERTSSPAGTRTPQHTASPQRTEAPERTPSPVRTVSGERTQPAEDTPVPDETRPPSTLEPGQTPDVEQTPVNEQTAIATSSPEVSPTGDAPSSTATNIPSTPPPTSVQSPTVAAVTEEPTARTTAAAEATNLPESCEAETQISFTNTRNYSGPGPYAVGVAVSNGGESTITDVVIGFSAVTGAEYLDEAAFGNGQLWWAHGQPGAAVLYAIPELNVGEAATIDLTGSFTSTWGSAAAVALNVSVVGPECASEAPAANLTLAYEPATDEFPASLGENATAPALTPSVSATPVEGAPPVRTVLGVSEAPAAATAAALGQTLPDTGAGSGGTGTTTWLIIVGLSLALVGLIAGAILANRRFPEGGDPPDRTIP